MTRFLADRIIHEFEATRYTAFHEVMKAYSLTHLTLATWLMKDSPYWGVFKGAVKRTDKHMEQWLNEFMTQPTKGEVKYYTFDKYLRKKIIDMSKQWSYQLAFDVGCA